jgi:hypothetical protein
LNALRHVKPDGKYTERDYENRERCVRERERVLCAALRAARMLKKFPI